MRGTDTIEVWIDVIDDHEWYPRWSPPLPKETVLALLDEKIRNEEGRLEWLKGRRKVVAESHWEPPR